MDDVAQEGTTVLLSSHNLRELEDVCDHVGIISKGSILLEHALSSLQENVVKVQLAFLEGRTAQIPEGMKLLHESRVGRVHTLIVRGSAGAVREVFGAQNPILMEILPLSLEEIFIYELGGEDYAIRELLV